MKLPDSVSSRATFYRVIRVDQYKKKVATVAKMNDTTQMSALPFCSVTETTVKLIHI